VSPSGGSTKTAIRSAKIGKEASLQPPEVILWDWDNTLVDGWAALTEAANVALTAFVLPVWTEAEMRARAVGSIRDTFPDIFGPDWRRAEDIFLTAYDDVHVQALRAMPGAEAALAAATMWPQGVVSNKNGDYLRREVAHLGWNSHFTAVVGAGDAAADKPRPEPIWHALAAIGIRPGPTIWYVGDTGSDMRAARAAGCTAVLLGDARHDGGIDGLRGKDAAPDLHYADASALATRFRALRGGRDIGELA
jgi:phosphoglycolate phosphatase